MKKLWVIFILFVTALSVCADLTTKKVNNLPDGVFKKTRGGEYVQLDKNGKKTGVYKIINGRLIKVK